MGSVRLKRNELPKIIRRLPKEMDKEVDRSGARLVPDLRAATRKRRLYTSRSVKTYEAGLMHCTVGVGVVGGAGFYVGFYELGTKRPNRFGLTFGADHRVGNAAEFFFTDYQDRMTRAIRRAVS